MCLVRLSYGQRLLRDTSRPPLLELLPGSFDRAELMSLGGGTDELPASDNPPTLSCTEAQEHSIREYTIEPIQNDLVINWLTWTKQSKRLLTPYHQSYPLYRKPKSKIATTPSRNKRRSTPKTARVRNRKENWYRDTCSWYHQKTLLGLEAGLYPLPPAYAITFALYKNTNVKDIIAPYEIVFSSGSI